jgi:hypothetical protein
MSRFSAAIAVSMILAGCGSSVDPPSTTGEELVTVIDATGIEQDIPAEELFERASGKSTVRKVLALDRTTGARCWIAAELLLREPPATARYLAVTRTLADDDEGDPPPD